jgi:methylmalonyl-CoA mutase N-terminal domain/subunit
MTTVKTDPKPKVAPAENSANGAAPEGPELAKLRAEVEDWRRRYSKGELRDIAFTNSAREVQPLYTPLDAAETDVSALPVPGEYPYTRGIHPTGYRGRLWTMRQFAGFGSASDTNSRYKFLLSHGQTGLSVAFDFPTEFRWIRSRRR